MMNQQPTFSSSLANNLNSNYEDPDTCSSSSKSSRNSKEGNKHKTIISSKLRLPNSQPELERPERTNNRIGVRKPNTFRPKYNSQSIESFVTIISDDESEPSNNENVEKNCLTVNEIAKLYDANLKKINKIKAKPPAKSNLISEFFKKGNVSINSDDDFDLRSKAMPPPEAKKSAGPKRKVRMKQPKITTNIKKKGTRKLIKKLIDSNQSDEIESLEGDKEPVPSTSQMETNTQNDKTSHFRHTLEQYGFKCRTYYDNIDITALFGPLKKGQKKNRARPTLLMNRSKERQQQLLEERVAILLEEEYKENVAVPIIEQPKYDGFSFYFEEFLSPNPRLFYVNSNAERVDNCIDLYYTNNLFPKSTVKSDFFLKDWSNIPGRERSPSPKRMNKETELHSNEPRDTEIEELEEVIMSSFYQNDKEISMDTSIELTKKYQDCDQSPVKQNELDNIQNLLFEQNILSGSCEDLFADTDEIICFETHTSDEVKTGNKSLHKVTSVSSESTETFKTEVKIADETPQETPDYSKINLIDLDTMDHNPIEDVVRKNKKLKSDTLISEKSNDDIVCVDHMERDLNESVFHQNDPNRTPFKQSISISMHNTSNEIIKISSLISRPSIIRQEYDVFDMKDQIIEMETEEIIPYGTIPGKHVDRVESDQPVSIHSSNSSVILTIPIDQEIENKPEHVGDIWQKIQSQLKDLEDETNKMEQNHQVKQLINEEDEELYTILSDTETSEFTQDEEQKEGESNENDEQDLEECEKTLIYYDNQKSFYNHVQEDNFMENLINKTIQEDDSPELEEPGKSTSETNKFYENHKTCQKSSYNLEDSFDELDALIYGVKPKKSSPVIKNPTPTKSPLQSTSNARIRNKFEELSTPIILKNNTATDKFIIRTRDVSPPPHYENMDDIKMEWEMKKYGLKYIKRREDRVKILNHIYIRTHPYIEIENENGLNLSLAILSGTTNPDEEIINDVEEKCQLEITDEGRIAKTQPQNMDKTFTSLEEKYGLKPVKSQGSLKRKSVSPKNPSKKIKTISDIAATSAKGKPVTSIKIEDFINSDISSEFLLKNDSFTSQLLLDDNPILPVKQKGKLQWCPLPLNIAFVNLLRLNPWLQIKILQYEPFEIEVLYKYFKSIGARYELSDLKLFFDKRSITFRSET